MYSFSSQPIDSHNRPAIILFLATLLVGVGVGFFLGDTNGREERQMLRRVNSVMQAVELERKPCAVKTVPYRVSPDIYKGQQFHH